MHRDGKYEAYKAFRVSREQERKWIHEWQEETLESIRSEADVRRLSTLVTELGIVLEDYVDRPIFSRLIGILREKVEGVDSFTQLRMSEVVLEVADKYRTAMDRGIVTDAMSFAQTTLSSMLAEPIKISAQYHLPPELVNEEKVAARAMAALGRCRHQNSSTP